MNNPYLPIPMIIRSITDEAATKDIKTFELAFLNKEDEKNFSYLPGQFAEISVLGSGEAPVGIASSPTERGILKFTIKWYPKGVVTNALHNMFAGDKIGIRGPFGNSFESKNIKNRSVVVIGGGFAFTTLRSLTTYMIHLNNRSKFKNITVIYGARSPGDLIYKKELEEWDKRDDMKLYVTVDKGDKDWKGGEGFVPTVVGEVKPSAENAVAIICGPPIMIKFTIPKLVELGFSPENILNSLEMRMKCGIGKCGRCNIGGKYVCKDGPIFSLAELNDLPKEY